MTAKQTLTWKAVGLIVLILAVDQVLKIWVKTHMALGEDFPMIGSWARIHFVENPGMAFGWLLGGRWGKLMLSLFRVAAIAAFVWYLRRLCRHGAPTGYVLCISLILAGAIGNMIDCAFYGLIFDSGTVFSVEHGMYEGYYGVSQFSSSGYAPFLQGCVVDMLSFPILQGTYPAWFPIIGGKSFLFFAPIFNIADSAVTVGGAAILLFYWKYLKQSSKQSR